jgi:hypothetical protein
MSFLGKALSVAGIAVGIAAAVATGGTLGILAGAVLAIGGASKLGLIKGSVGKFMNSGWGTALMATAALGTAATAMYGSSALDANAMEAVTQENTAALDSTVAQTAAADSTQAIQTSTSFLQGTDSMADVASIPPPDPAALINSGVNPASAQQVQQQLSGASAGAGQNAAAQQAAEAQEGQSTVANTGGGAAHSGPGIGGMTQAQAPAGADVTGASAPAPAPGGGANVLDEDNNLPGTTPAPNPAGTPGSNPGFLSKATDFLNTRGGAAAITAGGQMLGGLGAGIGNQAAMEKQIAAQQWATRSYADPRQAGALEASAAAPVNMPSGYLARAAALRSMMGSTGPQAITAPVSAIAPTTPLPGAH